MTLLIKGVHVLAPDKNFEESLDVFVTGDKISAIGFFPTKKADKVIEAQGLFLSPGFIDIDTTSDHYLSLFEDVDQGDFLKQGVTTIIGGQCGSSLAPLLKGNLDAIRKWSDTNSVNVDWHSVKELFNHLEKRRFGINFGTFIGHSTIRRALMSGKRGDLNMNEISIFSHILEESIKEGGLGMSTGLSYSHSRGTPPRELIALAKTLKKHNAIYVTHLRGCGKDLSKSIEETINLYQESGAKILVSHLVPIKGHEAFYKEALKRIEELPEESDFHFGIFTSPYTSVSLYSFLPEWAKGSLEKMYSIVCDESYEEKLLRDMEAINGSNFILAQAIGNNSLLGKNLQEIMKIFGLPNVKRALLKLMQTTKLRAVIHYKNLDQKLMHDAIRNTRSLISSHAPAFNDSRSYLKSERSTSTFLSYLKFVDKEKMDIGDSIKKITELPARKLGFTRRGIIKEGYSADLVLFRGSHVKHVVVNGEVVVEDGELTGGINGKILKNKNV